jgi:hypothetical protein
MFKYAFDEDWVEGIEKEALKSDYNAPIPSIWGLSADNGYLERPEEPFSDLWQAVEEHKREEEELRVELTDLAENVVDMQLGLCAKTADMNAGRDFLNAKDFEDLEGTLFSGGYGGKGEEYLNMKEFEDDLARELNRVKWYNDEDVIESSNTDDITYKIIRGIDGFDASKYVGSKIQRLGTFDTAEEAKNICDNDYIKYKLGCRKFAFEISEDEALNSFSELEWADRDGGSDSEDMSGVSYSVDTEDGKFKAYKYFSEGGRAYIGSFDSLDEAKKQCQESKNVKREEEPTSAIEESNKIEEDLIRVEKGTSGEIPSKKR